jgi:hypothetical protein
MTPDDLEGRLLAQRRILQLIVAALAGTPAGERIRERLGERATMQDGQEDPGAVETAGMAVELAVADEFRRIAEGIPDFAGGEAGGR